MWLALHRAGGRWTGKPGPVGGQTGSGTVGTMDLAHPDQRCVFAADDAARAVLAAVGDGCVCAQPGGDRDPELSEEIAVVASNTAHRMLHVAAVLDGRAELDLGHPLFHLHQAVRLSDLASSSLLAQGSHHARVRHLTGLTVAYLDLLQHALGGPNLTGTLVLLPLSPLKEDLHPDVMLPALRAALSVRLGSPGRAVAVLPPAAADGYDTHAQEHGRPAAVRFGPVDAGDGSDVLELALDLYTRGSDAPAALAAARMLCPVRESQPANGTASVVE